MIVVTSFVTLMRYARELGDAEASGDAKRIEEAQRKHDDYRDICLIADEMHLGLRNKDL
jgi:hypothetical protein